MNPFFHNLALPFLSDLIFHPLLTCTFCCCHGNSFTFFLFCFVFWIFFSSLDLYYSCFPPRNPLPWASKDLLVSSSHCGVYYNNPCSNWFHNFWNVTHITCRPSLYPLFTSCILDGLWSPLTVLVCLTLACNSLQIIIQTITKHNAGHRRGIWVIEECLFFTAMLSSQQYWVGSHSSKCDWYSSKYRQNKGHSEVGC